ncbi:MAG: aquaporin [Planctomycetia bacterium]|nr:aquaporin [Planctomycetia bacterium]
MADRWRAVAAEAGGTAFLLAAVVGSGIMGERLSGGSVGLALLANSLATGAALVALVAAFGPVSGAHFNPAVTLAEAWRGALAPGRAAAYVAAQVAGAVGGVAAAHAMFGGAIVQASSTARPGARLWFAEFVATVGLLAIVRGVSAARSALAPLAVGAYIASAYWFTASTSFANPAVTFARCWTDTFAGIRPADAPAFVAAQLAGAAFSAVLWPRLFPEPAPVRPA